MGKGAKQLKRQLPAKSAEQIAYERNETKKDARIKMKNLQRVVDYKVVQVDSGEITETRTIHTIPDGTAVQIDGFVNNKKPKHILENEIDELKFKIEFFEEQIKNIEELENAEKPT